MKGEAIRTVLFQLGGQLGSLFLSLAPVIGAYQWTTPEGILIGGIFGAIAQAIIAYRNSRVIEEVTTQEEDTPQSE